MRISTALKGVAVLIAAAVATAVAILYATDFNAYKGEIATLVRDATGRELVIEGDFAPRIGLTPAVAVDGVRFANAPWGSRGDMARIGRLRAEIELLPLFFGDIRIRQIVLSGADILLESQPDGTGNWVLGPAGGKAAAPSDPAERPREAPAIPTVDRVLIEDSVLIWRDGRAGTATTVRIDRLEAAAEAADAPLRLTLAGSYDGEPVTLTGAVGSLTRVTSGAPLAVDLTLAAGGAKASVKGTVRHPVEGRGVALAVSASGEDLASLRRLTGAALPAIGPWSLAASVADSGASWQLKGLTLKVGESDLGGIVTVDPSASPPGVTAELTSSLLRTADFVDRDPPKGSPGGAGTAPAATGGEARVFPDDPLPLDGLVGADVRLSLRAMRVELEKIALDDVSASVTLRDGDLAVQPATAEIAGGSLSAAVSLRGTRRTPRLALELTMAKLDLGRIIAEAGHDRLLDGQLDGKATLSGAGKSVRAIMAGLNGTVETTMTDGRLADGLLDVLSTDVLTVLSPGSAGDRAVRINCLVGRYDVSKGRMISRATVFDTDRLLVAGEGGVDLGTERIDFLLVPKAKQASLARFVVPLRVGGSLAAPTVYPDPAGIAKGALGVAAGIATGGILGLVLGGVLSGVTDGGADDACAAALAAGKADAGDNGRTRPPAQSPAGDVERAIEGVGEGLKGLFGR